MIVNDVLNLHTLPSARVIAGAGGLDRQVKWFHIIDIPQIIPWADEGDLIFSSGYALNALQGILEGLVECLYEKGISALFLVEELYLKILPQHMLDVADTLDFPIVVFPAETKLRDATHQIAGILLGDSENVLSEYEIFLEGITKIVLSNNDILQTVIANIKKTLNINVLLLDMFGRLLTSGNIHCEDDDFLKYFRKYVINKTGDTLRQTSYGNFEKPYIYYKIACQEQDIYMILLKDIKRKRKREHIFINSIVTIISALLNNCELMKKSLFTNQIPLLDCILNGEYTLDSVVYKKMIEQGWDMDANHIVAIFEVSNYNKVLTNNEFADDQIRKFRRELIDELIKIINAIQGVYPVIRQDLTFTTMFKLFTAAAEKRIIEGCSETMFCIKKKYDIDIIIGISTKGRELAGFSEKLTEARETLDRIKDMQNGSIATYEQIEFDMVVNKVVMDIDMKQTHINKIFALADYDAQYASNLMETLRIFSGNHGNIAKTARSLNVHRNTIKYRLQRIEEITEISLSSGNTFLNIALLLKIYEIRGKKQLTI